MGEVTSETADEEHWEEARRREEAIRSLLQRCPEGLKRTDVEDLAWELGLSRATMYRLIKRFRACGTVTSLVPAPRGRRKGHRMLDASREIMIRQTIEAFYLKPSKPSFERLVHEIRTRCLASGLTPPN
jgi:putative transposase